MNGVLPGDGAGFGAGLGATIAFVVSWVLAGRFSRPGSSLYVLDHPNERSLHSRPVPRSGGLAILAGVAAGAALTFPWRTVTITGFVALGGALLLAAIAQVDDRRGLAPAPRLLAQLLTAAAAVLAGLELQRLVLPGAVLNLPPGLAVVVSVLLVVWLTNLYNFMDGMDGFAGGMGVIGYGTLALLGARVDAWEFAALAALVAGACGGFLVLNRPPARIFMGDTGSSVLGFTAALMWLWADREGLFPLWIGVLIFSPFVVDATFTLVRRALAGERVWQAHRSHCYQRLVRVGWGHGRTVAAEYVLMLGCAASAFYAVEAAPGAQVALVVAWAVAYTGAIVVIYRLELPRG